jgi:hypothetical protein
METHIALKLIDKVKTEKAAVSVQLIENINWTQGQSVSYRLYELWYSLENQVTTILRGRTLEEIESKL